jgi:hypothetical protein
MMLAQPHASLASTSNFGLGHRYNGGSGVWWPVLIFVSNESGYMPPSCQLRSVLARLCGILIERYWVGAASTTTRTSPAARPQPGAKIQSGMHISMRKAKGAVGSTDPLRVMGQTHFTAYRRGRQ